MPQNGTSTWVKVALVITALVGLALMAWGTSGLILKNFPLGTPGALMTLSTGAALDITTLIASFLTARSTQDSQAFPHKPDDAIEKKIEFPPENEIENEINFKVIDAKSEADAVTQIKTAPKNLEYIALDCEALNHPEGSDAIMSAINEKNPQRVVFIVPSKEYFQDESLKKSSLSIDFFPNIVHYSRNLTGKRFVTSQESIVHDFGNSYRIVFWLADDPLDEGPLQSVSSAKYEHQGEICGLEINEKSIDNIVPLIQTAPKNLSHIVIHCNSPCEELLKNDNLTSALNEKTPKKIIFAVSANTFHLYKNLPKQLDTPLSDNYFLASNPKSDFTFHTIWGDLADGINDYDDRILAWYCTSTNS